jgi:excisionase family DNA binding protein
VFVHRPLIAPLREWFMTGEKRRRLVEFKGGCKHGRFGRTLAYRLIADGKIKAYKMGHKTMIDLNTVDAYHASLPTAEVRRASA